jgi:predicted RNase H-like HicB family nuclease
VLSENELSYTAVYEKVDDGWTQGRIAEIPGVITAAASRSEARELLRDALREYLASFMENDPALAGSGDREQLRVELVTAGEG